MSDSTDKSELLKRLVIDEQDQKESGNGFIDTPWFLGASCLLIGIVTGYFLFSNHQNDRAIQSVPAELAPQNMPSSTEKPVSKPAGLKRAQKEVLNASGYVTPRLVATVSSEVMGRLVTVEVEEGMQVSQGQVLATLDDAVAKVNWQLAQAQVRSQTARLRSLQSELAEAGRVQTRQLGLQKQGLTSEAEITRAQARVEQVRAALASADADLNVTKLQAQGQLEVLEDHTVRAPFSGVVTVKNAQPGEIVAPSSAGGGFTRTGVCTIVDMNSLEIEVDVNEAYIGRVAAGQKVVANLDAYPDWDIPASVIAVIPTADRSKATVRVRIAILEKDQRVLPQMGVKVAFLSDETNEVSIQ